MAKTAVRLILVSLAALLGGEHAAAAPVVPRFEHVVVIVFENKEQSSVLGRSVAPTFARLARSYAVLSRYYGVTHPSLPNYLALVSGSTQGISTDCTDCSVSGVNLADSLGAAGRTWKTYAEGLPETGFLGASSGRYAKKHDPLLYFTDVAGSAARRADFVPFSRLRGDLRTGKLPDFSLIVPDLCHSMHDCPVAAGDAWLGRIVQPLLRLPRTVVFVVFDEGSSPDRGGGHVPALALGTAVRPHSRFAGVIDHYGLLRTIEEAWSLRILGQSASARSILGIWR